MNSTASDTQALTTHSGDIAREWWERWLFLLPIMLWISFTAQFMWPAYPDIALLAVVWSLLTCAYLWFVYRNIRRQRQSWDDVEAAYNNEGTPVMPLSYKPLAVVLDALLLIVAILFTLGCLTFLVTIFSHPIYSQISYTPIYTFSTALYSTIFVIIWPSRIEALSRRLALGWMALLLVLIPMLLTYGMAFAMPRLLSGAPAPWPTLLAFAQHEAEKIDGTSHLDHVDASKYYFLLAPSDSQAPSIVTLYFTGREHLITVQVVDSDPPRLSGLKSESGYPAAFDKSKADLPGLKDRLAKVTIGPRDVYQETEGQGRAFAEKYGAAPSDLIVNVSLSFDPSAFKYTGVDSFWDIHYLVQTSMVPTGLKSMDIRVDVATGKIVDKFEN